MTTTTVTTSMLVTYVAGMDGQTLVYAKAAPSAANADNPTQITLHANAWMRSKHDSPYG
jgi:hypothetical protein